MASFSANPKVYLCGPISGLTYTQARKSWRQEAAHILDSHGIQALSPLRAQEISKSENPNTVIDKLGHEDKVTWTAKGITTKDRFLLEKSDIVLVNFLEAEKVSIGSVLEFGWADAYRKPVVLCMQKDNIHSHGMINEIAGFIVPTLEEGLKVTIDLLQNGA